MKQNVPSLFFFKRLIILLFILSFFFYNQPLFAQSINNLNASELSSIPKYENLKMWAAHPWKKDFSDSEDKDLEKEVKNLEKNNEFYDNKLEKVKFILHEKTVLIILAGVYYLGKNSNKK